MKKFFRVAFIYLILIELIILIYVFLIEPFIKEKQEATIPFLEIKSVWVDTILSKMTLDEKIGQLIMIQGNFIDSSKHNSTAKLIHDFKIGGIIFDDTILNENYENNIHSINTLNEYQSLSGIPLFYSRQKYNYYPTLLTIASISDISMVNQLATNLVNEDKLLGFTINFAPILRQGAQNSYENTFGNNELNIIAKGGTFCKVLKEKHILACVNNLSEIFIVPKDSLTNYKDKLFLPQSFFNKGVPMVRIAPDLILNSKEKMIAKRYLKTNLEKNFNYKGLIISEPISNVNNKRNEIEELLFAGVDIIILKNNILDNIKLIKTYLRNGYISDNELNEKVKKILLAKAWTGLDKRKPINKEKLLAHLKSEGNNLIKRKINEEAITLIKNTANQLPFKKIAEKDFHVLLVSKHEMPDFIEHLNFYKNIDFTKVNSTTNLNQFKIFNTLIVTFNKIEIDTIKYHAFLQSLKELDKRNNLVILNFGNPKNLQMLGNFKNVVQIYNNEIVSQQMAAQFIFGGISAKGILPLTINEKFQYGHHVDQQAFSRLKYTIPADVQMNSDSLQLIDSVIEKGIDDHIFPSCQVLVMKDGKVVYNKAFGYFKYDRKDEVTKHHLYDLASVTKVSATTLAVMKLVEQDSISLTDSVKYYLDDTTECNFKNIRLEEFLVHKSGLQADMPIIKYIMYRTYRQPRYGMYFAERPDSEYCVEVAEKFYFRKRFQDSLWKSICRLKVDSTRPFLYSDINLNIIQKVISKKMHDSLNNYVERNFYKPLGLRTMCFLPLKRFDKEQIVPTAEDSYWRHQLLHGYPHDESAALLGGVAGNAGLFSNANDLAIVFQMLLNGGTYGDAQLFKPETVKQFISRQDETYRGLGFAWNNHSFGHTGFTGTCVWANPENKVVWIILSNRIYPKVKARKSEKAIRDRIEQIINHSLNSPLVNPLVQ